MSVWAVIPVKPLNRAKSRLTSVLTPEQRYDLAQRMLHQVLSVVAEAPGVAGTLVVSRDTKALAIARDNGARTIQESSPTNLNPALLRATEVIRVWGGEAILVVPADLPFIAVNDVMTVIERGVEDRCMVIATDRKQDGTNILLVRPPGAIKYAYGPGSYQRHIELARAQGLTVHTYHSDSLRLDIDEPEDLLEYNTLVERGHYDFLSPYYQIST